MKILILGAAGMIGRKLALRLAIDGSLGAEPISALTLQDIILPEIPAVASFPMETAVSDLSVQGTAERLISGRPDVIFHLAAVVSGEAEADFEKGYRVNLDGTRALFEAVRKIGGGYRPRLVYASAIGVFGAPFPELIGDDFFQTPLTSYGTQKAICELLLSDFSRKGFIDGIGVRLPTICVRPGKPNRAASGFFSNIIREPLNGEEAVLPVGEDVRHWFASPRSAVRFLLRAAVIESEMVGSRRNLTMPGLSATVGEQIEALAKVAGPAAAGLIRRVPDQAILAIVEGWPKRFACERAAALGFAAETSFEEIIRAHIEDELGGKISV